MTEQTRAPRNLATRAAKARQWQEPSSMPEPTPEEGYTFRWIRTATLGQADARNMGARFREGFEPVRAEDHPEMGLYVISDTKHQFHGCIETGGLLLCKIPNEFVAQRTAYYNNRAAQEMEGVDNAYLRESDPRMPMLRPERKSEVSFGTGN